MVNVSVKKLTNRPGRGLSTDILDIPAANALAEMVGKTLKERVKDFVCEDHPNRTSSISVEAVKGKNPNINKHGLCCSKLSDRIQITFNN